MLSRMSCRFSGSDSKAASPLIWGTICWAQIGFIDLKIRKHGYYNAAIQKWFMAVSDEVYEVAMCVMCNTFLGNGKDSLRAHQYVERIAVIQGRYLILWI